MPVARMVDQEEVLRQAREKINSNLEYISDLMIMLGV